MSNQKEGVVDVQVDGRSSHSVLPCSVQVSGQTMSTMGPRVSGDHHGGDSHALFPPSFSPIAPLVLHELEERYTSSVASSLWESLRLNPFGGPQTIVDLGRQWMNSSMSSPPGQYAGHYHGWDEKPSPHEEALKEMDFETKVRESLAEHAEEWARKPDSPQRPPSPGFLRQLEETYPGDYQAAIEGREVIGDDAIPTPTPFVLDPLF